MKSIKYLSVIFVLFVIWAFSNGIDPKIVSSDEIHNTKVIQDGKFNVYRIDNKEMSFGVSMKLPTKSEFLINSNFFSHSGNPIGLVVMDRQRYSKRTNGGGYFYVVDGVPHVRVGFCPKMTDYASQTLLWGIDDGRMNVALFDKKLSKEQTSRSIIGEDSKGQIMVISSSDVDGCSIQELVEYASKEGMYEGIILDGGSSVEYKFTDSHNEIDYKSTNSLLKELAGRKEPPVYIYGYFK
jgi:hypothetical protein